MNHVYDVRYSTLCLIKNSKVKHTLLGIFIMYNFKYYMFNLKENLHL